MKNLFTVCFALCTMTCFAQKQVAFDFNGKVVKAPEAVVKTFCNDKTIVRQQALDSLSVLKQDSLRESLKSSFGKTAKTLRDTMTLRGRYYKLLWPGATTSSIQLASDFDRLIGSLNSKLYKQSLQPTSPLFSLDSLLANDLLKPGAKYYTISTSPANTICQIKLLVTNLENKLLLAHFASVARHPDNKPYALLNNRAFKEMLARAEARQKVLNPLLVKLRRPLSLAVLNEAYDTHSAFKLYRDSDLLFKILKAPWSKSWLWRYDGTLKLNPLPFTEDSLLFPLSDPFKITLRDIQAAHFDSYVNYVLAKKKTADKDFNINAYAEDVRSLSKGKYLFEDSTIYKRAITKNLAASLKYRTIIGLANSVSVPIFQKDTKYVTLLDNQKQPLLAPEKLGALRVETRVGFTLHNTEKGHTLTVKQARVSEVKDQSVTQAAIDEGLANLSVVKPGLGTSLDAFTKATAVNSRSIAGVTFPTSAINYGRSGGILTINKSNKKPKTPAQKSYEAASTDSLFWVEVKRVINFTISGASSNNDSYRFTKFLTPSQRINDGKVLAKVKSDFALDADLNSYFDARNERKYEKLVERIIVAYLKELANLAAPIALGHLKDDSLLVTASVIVVKESSIPPKTAKPETNKVPLLTTNHALTSQSDSTRAYTYVLQDEVGTKVTPFAAYQYRTGKRQWLRFSAGVAYTTRPARSPELSISNGQVNYNAPDNRYRVFAGVNYYPAGVMQQDERFLGTSKTWYTRINLLIGVSIPKPLDNFYFAPGYDFGPGIKLNAGLHLHGYNTYQVFNNQLINEAKVYKPLPFVSLGIDPASFVKAFTLLF